MWSQLLLSIISTAFGVLITLTIDWFRKREAKTDRRKQVGRELIYAASEFCAMMEMHRKRWLSPIENWLTVSEAAAEIVGNHTGDMKGFRRGLPGAMHTLQAWRRAERESGVSNAMPPMLRLAAAPMTLLFLGEEKLSEAAREVVNAAQVVALSKQKGQTQRERAMEELKTSINNFSSLCGLIDKRRSRSWRRWSPRRHGAQATHVN